MSSSKATGLLLTYSMIATLVVAFCIPFVNREFNRVRTENHQLTQQLVAVNTPSVQYLMNLKLRMDDLCQGEGKKVCGDMATKIGMK